MIRPRETSSSSDGVATFYQMSNVANCEMSDANEHDVMYTNFEMTPGTENAIKLFLLTNNSIRKSNFEAKIK